MLSGPHKVFAEKIAEGMNQTRAYMAAYPDSNEDSARVSGSRLLINDNIKAEVARLRKEAEKMEGSTTLTIAEKRAFCARVLRVTPDKAAADNPDSILGMSKAGPYYTFPDKLKALAMDNELMVREESKAAADAVIAIGEELVPDQIKRAIMRQILEKVTAGIMSTTEAVNLMRALTQEEKSQAQIYKLQTDAAEAVAELMADVEKAKGLRALAEDKTVPHSQYLEAVRQRMFGGNAIPAPGNAA